MPIQEIATCLEQKKILLTKVMNLTKQIQVRSRQEEIDLEDFLEQRVPYMERAKKCDDLISHMIQQFAPEEQERIVKILKGEIPEEECAEEELAVLRLSAECKKTFERIVFFNDSAYKAIHQQYESTRIRLNQLRKDEKRPSMFSDYQGSK